MKIKVRESLIIVSFLLCYNEITYFCVDWVFITNSDDISANSCTAQNYILHPSV